MPFEIQYGATVLNIFVGPLFSFTLWHLDTYLEVNLTITHAVISTIY